MNILLWNCTDSSKIAQTIHNITSNQIASISDCVGMLKFSSICAAIALLFFIVDFCSNKLTGKRSFLGIQYKPRTFFITLGIWVLGAFCVGMLSSFSDIVKINRIGIMTIGCSWPLIFTTLTKSSKPSSDPTKNSDENGDEE